MSKKNKGVAVDYAPFKFFFEDTQYGAGTNLYEAIKAGITIDKAFGVRHGTDEAERLFSYIASEKSEAIIPNNSLGEELPNEPSWKLRTDKKLAESVTAIMQTIGVFTAKEVAGISLIADRNAQKLLGKEYRRGVLTEQQYKAIKSQRNSIGAIGQLMSATMDIPQEVLNRAGTELRDAFCCPYVFEEWLRSKKVYRPDRDFLEALIDTEKTGVRAANFEHLPCRVFWLDLEHNEDLYGELKGAWVWVSKDPLETKDEIYQVYILALDNAYIFRTHRSSFVFHGNNVIEVSKQKCDDAYVYDTTHSGELNKFLCDCKEGTPDYTHAIHWGSVIMTVMQMLIYLGAKEPDMTPRKQTAQCTFTKKKGQVVKPVIDVDVNEVGIHIGTRLRLDKERIRKEGGTTRTSSGTRKRPCAYLRSAHWSHYWTGKGRVNYEVRWIEPVFCGGKEAQNITVVPVGDKKES